MGLLRGFLEEMIDWHDRRVRAALTEESETASRADKVSARIADLEARISALRARNGATRHALDLPEAAPPAPAPHTYRMTEHKGWGNTMFWHEVPDSDGRGRIYGHLRRRPRPGDHIISPMQSGRNAVFKVAPAGHTYPHDPPDMYFVAVTFVGYEDDLPPTGATS